VADPPPARIAGLAAAEQASRMGIEVTGPRDEATASILTGDALEFVALLQRTFGPRRAEFLQARRERQAGLDAGETPRFLPQTRDVRDDPTWRVAPPAPGLVDRRCEITGPTEPKMLVNALNSGARVFMADFEDANTPTWANMVGGQRTLVDAVARRIDFASAEGKRYTLDENVATLVVRPRGWHLDEKHVRVDGAPVSASLFDFGLAIFHALRERPYFYLPKLENHLEARLWNDVFGTAQDALGLPRGTVRATVLIETIIAAFEMEEILYELREHAAGLNAGRWDYLFSVIKKFRNRGKEFLLPDRNAVTMTAPFMRAYTELLVHTCHKRGAFAIGGMAAFIPSRRDPAVNAVALERVRADKEREAGDGFDGSWVAHPDLVPVCTEVFDAALGERPNQLDRLRDDVDPAVLERQLLAVADTPGEATLDGLRNNVAVGLRYLAAWLRGNGAVAIFNLMEDAATAEIARSQVWQWVHAGVYDAQLVRRVLDEELAAARGEDGDWDRARALFEQVALADDFVEFLTLPAYDLLE
jgi:malate synthase